MRFSNFTGKIIFGKQRLKNLFVNSKNTKKISILGCDNAVGVTHTALMIANYYANGLGKNTAIIEWNDNKDFIKICQVTSNLEQDIYNFKYKNITFISKCNYQKKFNMNNFDVVVYDCGCFDGEDKYMFMECDERILVCSTLIYKIGRCKKILGELGGLATKIISINADDKAKKLLEKTYGVDILKIPNEGNPLRISSKTLVWIRDVLGD